MHSGRIYDWHSRELLGTTGLFTDSVSPLIGSGSRELCWGIHGSQVLVSHARLTCMPSAGSPVVTLELFCACVLLLDRPAPGPSGCPCR